MGIFLPYPLIYYPSYYTIFINTYCGIEDIVILDIIPLVKPNNDIIIAYI